MIGIDVGGTNMQFGVVDATGALIGRAAAKTEADEGLDHVLDNIVAGLQAACRAADLGPADIAAVGVVAAGAMDIPNGLVLIAPNLDWRDVPLRDLLQQRIGRPVVLNNDVNGATWAEYQLGAGDGQGDALGVWVGTGVGAGLVLGGRLHTGDFFTAGEIGHTVIEPAGPAGRRTVEDLCSRTGIRNVIGDRLPDHPGSIIHELTGGDMTRLGTEQIKSAYEAGDALAVDVIHRAADRLGVAIANFVTMLAMRTVFIGGGITEALGEPYLDRVRASFLTDVFPARCRDCRLVMTKLAADSGLLGAALLARRATAEAP
ncbi:MAG: ROK family protein [Planctomycetota bacterium]|nr:ROK family protein [Planctomycetota bacterium]